MNIHTKRVSEPYHTAILDMDNKTIHNIGLECFVGFKYTDNFVEENANKPQRQV